MQKRFVVIAVLIMLALPAGAQNLDFLFSLMKTIVEEYGIEQVIGVLEELGHIGEGEVAISDVSSTSAKLTVNHEIWGLPNDEMVDVLISLMSDSGDEMCWNYVNLGTSEILSASQRVGYRASFIQECVNQ